MLITVDVLGMSERYRERPVAASPPTGETAAGQAFSVRHAAGQDHDVVEVALGSAIERSTAGDDREHSLGRRAEQVAR